MHVCTYNTVQLDHKHLGNCLRLVGPGTLIPILCREGYVTDHFIVLPLTTFPSLHFASKFEFAVAIRM